MKKDYDVTIIGAGASGLSCAITIKREKPSLSVAIFEKKEEVGKKIRISGKGKCNITNKSANQSSLAISFFDSLGISLVETEEGRLYPTFKDGNMLADLLEKEAKKLGVEILLNTNIISIEKNCKAGFSIKTEKDIFSSGRLVLATGGKSYPVCGTTGDGYIFLRGMGHRIETLIPGLTGVTTVEDTKSLDGKRMKATVKLFKNDELIFKEDGEVQFAKGRISGIVVMNASLNIRKENDYILHIEEQSTGNILEFTPSGLTGWKEAQITCGGIPLSEVNDSMESKIVPGLYILGELLNYQGPCGGYNLNNAWVTGIKAGKAIANEI